MRTAGSISSCRRPRAGPSFSRMPGTSADLVGSRPRSRPPPGASLRAGSRPGLAEGGEATLHLVRDDVPVRGRVLDSQGRPVVGVIVRIRAIWELNDQADHDALLASGALEGQNGHQITHRFGSFGPATPTSESDSAPLWPGGRNGWTTDADGRFEVRGIGRDRIARLEFHGGGVADGARRDFARRTPVPSPGRGPAFPGMKCWLAAKEHHRHLPAGDAARRRDLRLRRQSCQTDHWRRPPEGLRQAVRRRRRSAPPTRRPIPPSPPGPMPQAASASRGCRRRNSTRSA